MSIRTWTIALLVLGLLLLLLTACNPNPQAPALTPIPTLAPGVAPTLAPSIAGQPATAPTPTAGVSGTTPTAGAAAGNATHGMAIFQENCTPCHGNNAQGSNIAPALRNNRFITSGDQAVFQTIANGRPGTAMPTWLQANGGSLSSNDITDVIAYLKTLQGVQ